MLLIFVFTISAAATTIAALSFSSRASPLVVPFIAACCGAFAVSAMLLVPADATTAALMARNSSVVVHPSPALVSFWRALYWVALLLGWLATETLCELLVAGDFSAGARLRSAVRASMRLYALVAMLAVAGALYLVFWLDVPLVELPSLSALLVNLHGLVVLGLMDGIGLVELPRMLWATAAPRAALAQHFYAVALTEEARGATAGRLQSLLQRVSAADAAAPPPEKRAPRERQCWDALLKSARVAAAECHLAELDGAGGSLAAWGLRTGSACAGSAWAHTIGTARPRDESALAKLRRRVRVSGGHARRAWQRREGALHDAALLCERLTANEKGFGGAGVGRSRGVWLGLLRRPTLRAVAATCALASAWVLINEACGLVRLLPPPYCHTLPPYCPAPSLHAALATAGTPFWIVLLDVATISHVILSVIGALRRSRLLAAFPLVPWQSTDGLSLLRHAAWALRLSGPLASHFLLLATSRPEETAFSAALGRIWHLSRTVDGVPPADGAHASGALGYHGLCSLITLLAAACSLCGRCGCGTALRATIDPACRRYDGRGGQRAHVKRGERMVRHYLASRGTMLLAASAHGESTSTVVTGGSSGIFCGLSSLSGLGGGGGLSGGSLGAGLCGATSTLSPSLLGDDALTDAEIDDDDDDDDLPGSGRRRRRSSHLASATAPSTPTPSRGAFPPPPRSQGGGARGSSSAPGRVGPGATSGAARPQRSHGPMAHGPMAHGPRKTAIWARLLSAHGGGAAHGSSMSDDDTDLSSDDGAAEDDGAYSSLPRWAVPRSNPSSTVIACGGGGGSKATGGALPAAKRVWDAIRQSHGGATPADGTGEGTAHHSRWTELTNYTGAGFQRDEADESGGGENSTWRALRAQAGA